MSVVVEMVSELNCRLPGPAEQDGLRFASGCSEVCAQSRCRAQLGAPRKGVRGFEIGGEEVGVSDLEVRAPPPYPLPPPRPSTPAMISRRCLRTGIQFSGRPTIFSET